MNKCAVTRTWNAGLGTIAQIRTSQSPINPNQLKPRRVASIMRDGAYACAIRAILCPNVAAARTRSLG
ncbi:MAG: hypothetical protein EZS28_045320 [Streblomastix strix]|uniref:Uncharacterized protein n=1 Tax=Streblomastix strix TaxID=222440 RepID=A0A5J4TMX9_9EUKA|nr:MAG: hypothetical protein EZS28_045320 [Streblomastix strix]